MKLNEKIRYYRKMYNLTQDELGEACSVDRSTIANWERGYRIPNITYMIVLASTFGCSLDELQSESDSSESKLVGYKYMNNFIDDTIQMKGDDFIFNCDKMFSYSHKFDVELSNVIFPEFETLKEYDKDIHKLNNTSIKESYIKKIITLIMVLIIVILVPFDIEIKNNLQSFTLDDIDKVELEVKSDVYSDTYEMSLMNGDKIFELKNKYILNEFDSEFCFNTNINIDKNDNFNYKYTKIKLSVHILLDNRFIALTDKFQLNSCDSIYNEVKISHLNYFIYLDKPGIYDIIFYRSNNEYYIGAFLSEI